MNAEVVRQIERLGLRDPLENISAEFPADYYDVHVRHLVEDARRWVAAREQGSNEYDSTPEAIAEIKAQLIKNGASKEFMESPEWWGRLEKLLKNPGVVGVMYEGGIESRFLAPLLLAMPSSMALEPAFLHGLTIDLKYEEITPSDVYFETVRREDLFKYIRMRTAFSGDILKIIQPEKSVFYSCGRMFTTRFITPLKDSQHAVCTDIDPTVKAEALFPVSSVRSHYVVFNNHNETFVEKRFVKNAEFAENLGHLIYTFTEEHYTAANDFMVKAISTMKPGGVMVFDLNCAHHDWEKLLLPMAWARGQVTMTLLKDNQTVKEFVKDKLLKDAPVEQLISKDIVIRGQDIGVVFAAIRS